MQVQSVSWYNILLNVSNLNLHASLWLVKIAEGSTEFGDDFVQIFHEASCDIYQFLENTHTTFSKQKNIYSTFSNK